MNPGFDKVAGDDEECVQLTSATVARGREIDHLFPSSGNMAEASSTIEAKRGKTSRAKSSIGSMKLQNDTTSNLKTQTEDVPTTKLRKSAPPVLPADPSMFVMTPRSTVIKESISKSAQQGMKADNRIITERILRARQLSQIKHSAESCEPSLTSKQPETSNKLKTKRAEDSLATTPRKGEGSTASKLKTTQAEDSLSIVPKKGEGGTASKLKKKQADDSPAATPRKGESGTVSKLKTKQAEASLATTPRNGQGGTASKLKTKQAEASLATTPREGESNAVNMAATDRICTATPTAHTRRVVSIAAYFDACANAATNH